MNATASSKSAEEWAQKNLEGWPPKTIALAVELIKKSLSQRGDADQVTWTPTGPEADGHLQGRRAAQLPQAPPGRTRANGRLQGAGGQIADLLKYNGSPAVDRIRALPAHSYSEQQNPIALNIANDIVKGERNVEQALAYHAQIIVGLRDREP